MREECSMTKRKRLPRIVNAWAELMARLGDRHYVAPGVLDRCAKEPEFVTAIVHETSERPNEFVFYEQCKGTRAEFDAIQGPKPYRKAYMENVKQFLERVDVE